MIVLYAGDNDLAAGKSPEKVFADFHAFIKKMHEHLPETRVAFISIKPCPLRWRLNDKVRGVNQKIAAIKDDKLIFVDVYPAMIRTDGKPKPDLFLKDGLHPSAKCYQMWARNNCAVPGIMFSAYWRMATCHQAARVSPGRSQTCRCSQDITSASVMTCIFCSGCKASGPSFSSFSPKARHLPGCPRPAGPWPRRNWDSISFRGAATHESHWCRDPQRSGSAPNPGAGRDFASAALNGDACPHSVQLGRRRGFFRCQE